VWATRPGVAPTRDGSFGLVVSEIPGTVYRDFFEKILGPGTTIEAVQIRGRPGWWISGAPHDFLYVDPSGEPTYDNRRLVGDTLAWSDGTTTYRIETGLGRDDAVRIAESFH
jgi:hypothetical protein